MQPFPFYVLCYKTRLFFGLYGCNARVSHRTLRRIDDPCMDSFLDLALGHDLSLGDLFSCLSVAKSILGKLGQELMKLKNKTDATVAQTGQTPLRKAIDTLAVNEHLAAGRRIERAHNLKQRGLAGATAADDAHQLALADGEINALKHFKRTETLVDVFQLYHWPWSG